MSRNSKNARNVARRKANTAARQSGGGGPKSTTPKHGKKNAWWQVGNGSYTAFIKGKAKRQNTEAEAP